MLSLACLVKSHVKILNILAETAGLAICFQPICDKLIRGVNLILLPNKLQLIQRLSVHCPAGVFCKT